MIRIDEQSVTAFLEKRGIIPEGCEAVSQSLGGGISNQVLMVRWEGECVVVKQPLEKLNVEMDWPADLKRIHIEANALRTYRRLIDLSGMDGASSPQVMDEDIDNHIIVMECIPGGSDMWKSELMTGEVDQTIARKVGEILGSVQSRASRDEEVRSMFAFKDHFDELRIDPYHRTAAERNPDISHLVLAEAERVFSNGMTLVHGDYSPKSVLVERSSGASKLWVFDMEVAHWGDPSFDTGFMLNHLLMKAIHLRDMVEEFIEAAFGFWDSYEGRVEWDIESTTMKELGCLMLSRADGKSPAEYLSFDQVDRIRRIARRSLKEGVITLEGYIQMVREEW
jgi:5-methylthioribose kinase